MICLFGKIVERIYIFPWKEVIRVKGISIYKNPMDAHGDSIISRYEQYRVVNEDELKNANKIWARILENIKKNIKTR